jgi:hypothetical protein
MSLGSIPSNSLKSALRIYLGLSHIMFVVRFTKLLLDGFPIDWFEAGNYLS